MPMHTFPSHFWIRFLSLSPSKFHLSYHLVCYFFVAGIIIALYHFTFSSSHHIIIIVSSVVLCEPDIGFHCAVHHLYAHVFILSDFYSQSYTAAHAIPTIIIPSTSSSLSSFNKFSCSPFIPSRFFTFTRTYNEMHLFFHKKNILENSFDYPSL